MALALDTTAWTAVGTFTLAGVTVAAVVTSSLQRDAEVDPQIRRKILGHADQAMTSHYAHIEAEAHRAAAEAVARLVEGAAS